MDFVAEIRKNLDLPSRVREEVVAEIESHYAWTCEDLRARGMSDNEAAAQAAREIGDPGDIARRLQTVHIGSTWKAAFLTALPFLGVLFLPKGGLLLMPQVLSADAGMWARTGWCLAAVLILGSLRELALNRRPVWLPTWLAGAVLLPVYWVGFGVAGSELSQFLLSHLLVIVLTVLAVVTWGSSGWKWIPVGLAQIDPFSDWIGLLAWNLTRHGYTWGISLGMVVHWLLLSTLWVGAAMGVFWKHRYGNSAQGSLFLYTFAVFGVTAHALGVSDALAAFAVVTVVCLGEVTIGYARASSLVAKRTWLAAGLLAQATIYMIVGDAVIPKFPADMLALYYPPYNIITQLLLVLVAPMWVEFRRGDEHLEISPASLNGRNHGAVGRASSRAGAAFRSVLEERHVLPAVIVFTWAFLLAGHFQKPAGLTERVSVSSTGEQGYSAGSIESDSYCSISADGRYVAFSSGAGGLVPDDTIGESDVFVRDRIQGVTERVSVSSAEEQGGESFQPSISADGRYVAFQTFSGRFVEHDANGGAADVFVRDRQTGTTELVGISSSGEQPTEGSGAPAISANGRFVAFVSSSPNLVTGDTNKEGDVFIRDRKKGITQRVSVSSKGEQANGRSGADDGIGISANGRFVVFNSYATNLVSGDTNKNEDVFIHDRQTGLTERVSVSSAGEQTGSNESCQGPCSVSADGRYVVFCMSSETLVKGTNNNNVYVRDRKARTTRIISIPLTDELRGPCYNAAITPDGRYVVFCSISGNLVPGDTNAHCDVFVRDMLAGKTRLVSLTCDGVQGNDDSGERELRPAISADGKVVAFPSDASNLVRGDTNGTRDVFVRELSESGAR